MKIETKTYSLLLHVAMFTIISGISEANNFREPEVFLERRCWKHKSNEGGKNPVISTICFSTTGRASYTTISRYGGWDAEYKWLVEDGKLFIDDERCKIQIARIKNEFILKECRLQGLWNLK